MRPETCWNEFERPITLCICSMPELTFFHSSA